jgi:hypothetical protein
MDLVIPLGPLHPNRDWGDYMELRYLLRSIETNLIDIDKIFIIGQQPKWVQNIIFIPFGDPNKYNKDANIIRKIIEICKREDLSENFIRVSDDYLFLKPILSKNLIPYHRGDLKDYDFKNKNRWRHRLENTFKILQNEGKATYNYESHLPVVINKKKWKEIWDKYIWDVEATEHNNNGYTINTIYFNNIDCARALLQNEKATFEKSIEDYNKILEIMKNPLILYMGYNSNGLTDNLKTFIKTKFPNKSKYESD